MRKFFLVALSVLFTLNVNASESSVDDTQFCGVLSQYAWLILNGRLVRGLEKEEQWPLISRTNNIHPTMIESIKKIINLVYRDDFPIMRDAASAAMFTSSINITCLEERRE